MRFIALAIVVFALAACNSAASGPTSSTSSSTTTIDDDTCERVAEATVSFVTDLIDELDETRLIDFRERDAWSDDLVKLERLGTDLDIRAEALRCDASTIRQFVLERVDLATQGPLSEGLVDFLLAPPTTTTTTTGAPPSTEAASDSSTTTGGG